jgi:hypothetical protein
MCFVYFSHRRKNNLEILLQKIEAAHDPIIILASLFSPTLLETFRALSVHRTVFIVARQWVGEHAGYEILPTSRCRLIDHYILNFDEMLFLLRNIKNGKIIFIAESMSGSDWDAMKTVIFHTYASDVMHFPRIQQQLLFIML